MQIPEFGFNFSMSEDFYPQQFPHRSSGFNSQGLNFRLSQYIHSEGEFSRLVNVDPYPQGALRKRAGYTTLLGTPDNNTVTNMFDWHKDNGTTFQLYRTSGTTLYYSTQGTGAWTVAGNGTIANGSSVGYAVVNNTLTIGDGVGSTRYSTDGQNFTNTTGAPVARYFADFQQKVWAAQGTNPALVSSVTGDPTNWGFTGTSDGTTVTISSGGGFNSLQKTGNRLVAGKTSGNMFKWDGYTLLDTSTTLAPTSALSIGSVGDYKIYLNRKGYFGFDGASPQIISNPLQPQIYNDVGSAIAGGTFDNASAAVYKYDYYASVGTVTDDITRNTVSNALQIYNFQYNSWRNYEMGTLVSSLWSYKDNNLNEQLIFGDNNGQCYTMAGTATTDNGQPIQALIEYIYTGGLPEVEKEFDYCWLFFNPGCQAHIQVAISDSWVKEKLNWVDLGDIKNGIAEFKFGDARGRLLFVRISESSRNTRFIYYGCSVKWSPLLR